MRRGSPHGVGVRLMFELMARDPRLGATAVETVGLKGWRLRAGDRGSRATQAFCSPINFAIRRSAKP